MSSNFDDDGVSGEQGPAIPSTEPAIAEQKRPRSQPQPRWLLPVITGAGGLILGLLLGGVGYGVYAAVQESNELAAKAAAVQAEEDAKSDVFLGAVSACKANGSNAVISDEGHSLTIESKGEDDASGLDYVKLFCIMDELGAPTAVTSHMDQTTSMDGRQTESWDDITLSFSYHPDRGMDSVLTID